MISRKERIEKLYTLLNPCRLCPHACGIDRFASAMGRCGSGKNILISSSNLHFGEEPPVSGFKGSGTIFFTNCNLSCVFCQNYPISQLRNGNPATVGELAEKMLDLQKQGAHNINFVTPTHFAPQIVEAVYIARDAGLNIPLVYNCGGYEAVGTLELLEGIIDIYMPDAKYSDAGKSQKYSSAPNYWTVNKKALKEMHRQAGNLEVDDKGVARKGLLIRHLVLPNDISGSSEVLEFIAKELSPDTYVSIMSQYHPANKTDMFPELSRKVSAREYNRVVKLAENLGLDKGWIQEL
ncbi:MAG: radical SAM protein [Elusimicrobiota bacterium]